MAAAVFVALVSTVGTGRESVGLVAGLLFVVGVGLPGGNLSVAGPEFLLIVAGGVWGFVGSLIPLLPLGRAPSASLDSVPTPIVREPMRSRALHAAAVAVTVALGLGVGLALGLPRDFWIMLTVLVALRPDLSDTVVYSILRILGTIVGASVAFAITISTGNPAILSVTVVLASGGLFSTRAVNYSLYTAFITIFLIVLLNLAYVGGPSLAVTRVFDTLIGSALALAVGAAMVLAHRARSAWGGPGR